MALASGMPFKASSLLGSLSQGIAQGSCCLSLGMAV